MFGELIIFLIGFGGGYCARLLLAGRVELAEWRASYEQFLATASEAELEQLLERIREVQGQ